MDDAVGDQEPPFPSAEFDLLGIDIHGDGADLVVAWRIDGRADEQGLAQYLANIDHGSWTYIPTCVVPTIDPESRGVRCDLSRAPRGGEGGAGAFEHVASDLAGEPTRDGLQVRIPYGVLGAEAGDPMLRLYAASQFAVSQQETTVSGSGSISPLVTDRVLGQDAALVLCDADGSVPGAAQDDAVAPRDPTRDASGAPLAWVLLGLVGLVRRR